MTGKLFGATLGSIMMLAAGCSGDAPTEAAASGTERPSASSVPSPSPTQEPRPPKPSDATQARLEGTFTVGHTLIESENLSGAGNYKSRNTYVPKCKEGPCNTIIQSGHGKRLSEDRLAYVKGRYRASRTLHDHFTCGTPGNMKPVPTVQTYILKPTRMALVEGAWIVTRFEGSIDYKSVSPCGFSYIETHYILNGRLD